VWPLGQHRQSPEVQDDDENFNYHYHSFADSASAANNQECPSRGTEISKIIYETTQNNSVGDMDDSGRLFSIIMKG